MTQYKTLETKLSNKNHYNDNYITASIVTLYTLKLVKKNIFLKKHVPVDCLAQTNKFKTKEMPKTAPGNKNADSNALDFQALPSNNLYKRDAL